MLAHIFRRSATAPHKSFLIGEQAGMTAAADRAGRLPVNRRAWTRNTRQALTTSTSNEADHG